MINISNNILKTIETKVCGVQFENLDGTDRQLILKNCKEKEKLLLKHEPNIQSPDAVKICRTTGEQLGWLSDDVSHEIVPFLTSLHRVEATIAKLTGGGFFAGRNRGCHIKITIFGG